MARICGVNVGFGPSSKVSATVPGNAVLRKSFSEFLSFWVFIIKASDNEILTLEGNSKNFEVNKYFSFEDFEKRFRYTSIPGYWITYIGNNPKNTCGLIESYLKSKPKDEARDFKFLLLNI